MLTYDTESYHCTLEVFQITVVIPLSLTISYIPLFILHVPARVYLDGQHEIFEVFSVVYSLTIETPCFAAFSSSLPYLFLPLPFPLLPLGWAVLPHP